MSPENVAGVEEASAEDGSIELAGLVERVLCLSRQLGRRVGLVEAEVECLQISLHLYCQGKVSGWGEEEEGDPGGRGDSSVLALKKEWGIGEGNGHHCSSGGGEGWAWVGGECWEGEGDGQHWTNS